MSVLDLDAFAATPLAREPYDHMNVTGFVAPAAIGRVLADFPPIAGPGSFPAAVLDYGPGFAALLAELEGPAVRDAFAAKFGMDLRHRPTMVTVRGRAQRKDGGIHTDSESKLITALIYLNTDWAAAGGRLRVLRSPDDLDDYAAEVPPVAGTLLAFRRSERSWHGHHPFEGERRSVQLNWVTDAAVVRRELARHRVSAWTKRLLARA
jgi:hypothetical protein